LWHFNDAAGRSWIPRPHNTRYCETDSAARATAAGVVATLGRHDRHQATGLSRPRGPFRRRRRLLLCGALASPTGRIAWTSSAKRLRSPLVLHYIDDSVPFEETLAPSTMPSRRASPLCGVVELTGGGGSSGGGLAELGADAPGVATSALLASRPGWPRVAPTAGPRLGVGIFPRGRRSSAAATHTPAASRPTPGGRRRPSAAARPGLTAAGHRRGGRHGRGRARDFQPSRWHWPGFATDPSSSRQCSALGPSASSRRALVRRHARLPARSRRRSTTSGASGDLVPRDFELTGPRWAADPAHDAVFTACLQRREYSWPGLGRAPGGPSSPSTTSPRRWMSPPPISPLLRRFGPNPSRAPAVGFHLRRHRRTICRAAGGCVPPT